MGEGEPRLYTVGGIGGVGGIAASLVSTHHTQIKVPGFIQHSSNAVLRYYSLKCLSLL